MKGTASLYISIFLLLIIGNSTLKAQDKIADFKNEFKIEGSGAFTGTGDLPGLGLGAEYRSKFKHGLSTGIGLSFFQFKDPGILQGSKEKSNSSSRYNATAGEFTIYKSFVTGRLEYELGIGAIVRHWYMLDLRDFYSPWGSQTLVAVEEYTIPGYTASLGWNYKLSPIAKLSLRGVLQDDTEENILWSVRLGASRSF
jgi:hypothetical protein